MRSSYLKEATTMIARFPTMRVLKWLKTTQQARLLHRFDHVCNIVNERDEIVSLVTQQIGRGPFSIVIDGSISAEWRTATPIEVNNRSIQIGRNTLTIVDSIIWDAKPNWLKLRALDFAKLPEPRFQTTAFQQKTIGLVHAIMNNNAADLTDSAVWLAGRGNGLTPTGDDILIGILFAMQVWQPQSTSLSSTTDIASKQTTTLSANFLHAAAAGEAVEAWHGLVSAETATQSDAVERILAIGATSGADAWSGFVQASVLFSNMHFVQG
jgi:hypothetical protein